MNDADLCLQMLELKYENPYDRQSVCLLIKYYTQEDHSIVLTPSAREWFSALLKRNGAAYIAPQESKE